MDEVSWLNLESSERSGVVRIPLLPRMSSIFSVLVSRGDASMCRSSLKDVVALDEIRRLMAINAHP